MEPVELATDIQYLVSACLSVRSRNAGTYQIAHLLTGKQYQITRDVARMLALLQKAISTSDLYDALPDLRPAAIDRAIQFLLDEKLIVDAEQGATEDLFHVNQLSNRLFDLPDHQRTSEAPGLVFIGVPYGGGNGVSPGCERFPSVVRAYTKSQKINLGPDTNLNNIHLRGLHTADAPTDLIERLRAGELRDWGDLLFFPFESATDVYAKIGRAVELTAQRGQVPVLLGGDHSISYAGIRAIADHYGPIQVIHFDAHCDTYESSYNRLYARRGAHSHGTFMQRCLEMPNLRRVTQIGLRGFTNISQHDTDRRQIFWAEDVRRALVHNTLPAIANDLPAYVTFDIDVLDPAVAPGTATPVPGGFTYDEVCQLFDRLLPTQRIVGLDLVEVNPDRDRDQITVQTAAQLLLLLASYVRS